jgi:hypothetical protein
MITRQQSILIHTALRDIRQVNLDFDDAQYRTTLRSICHVESSKDLSQSGVEQLLAFFESIGWSQPGSDKGYWAKQAAVGGGRQEYSVDGLCRKYNIGGPYLAGIIARITHDRTDHVSGCNAYEQGKIIEALKAIGSRAGDRTGRKSSEYLSKAFAPSASSVKSAVKTYSPHPMTEQQLQQIEEDAIPI